MIRAFAHVEHHVGKVEPPCSDTEPLERFRALASLQRGLEGGAGLLQRTT
jgi:hypothetical protein